MIARTVSCAVRGLGGVVVSVEADLANGLPAFTIVGLTDRAIQEARERVKAAVRNAGFDFPQRRLTVNLAPAEVPKEGTGFDLAIALAVIVCTGRALDLGETAALGELALDATVRPVTGVLPMARGLRAAGVRRLLVPVENGPEAALVEGLEVVPVPTLQACLRHLDGVELLPGPRSAFAATENGAVTDVADVRGQETAKRALEIAAAGGHNVLMLGPPGAGKTMLARALASLLPDLTTEESLEVAALYSLRGALRERAPTSLRPPFRAPHHSVSRAGLIGGGTGLAHPGEISLAHRGVLLLDEACEFPRSLLEALRQPLEERTVTVTRARGSVTFPAAFTLVAAANPCPCGHLGDGTRPCTCDPRCLAAYQGRLSGPMRDRLDLCVSVPRQPFGVLFAEDGVAGPTSAAVRHRIDAARRRQRERAAEMSTEVTAPSRFSVAADSHLNAALDGSALAIACRPLPAAVRLLAAAGERLGLSARAFHRVLRVSRTIADLAGEERVGEVAVAEALRYRAEASG